MTESHDCTKEIQAVTSDRAAQMASMSPANVPQDVAKAKSPETNWQPFGNKHASGGNIT